MRFLFLSFCKDFKLKLDQHFAENKISFTQRGRGGRCDAVKIKWFRKTFQ